MKASYGYKDATGDFFITIDTDLCDGCGACITACFANVLMIGENENDPLNEKLVATIAKEQRKKIRYSCESCKPSDNRPPLPCQISCKSKSIEHSW